jgi:ATP-dependent Clp protease ATP-binding subunit ClpC
MTFTIPILVEEISGSRGESFVLRPLFHPEPTVRERRLSVGLNKLNQRLSKQLEGLAKDMRLDPLATWAFSPECEEQTLDLRLELKDGSARYRLFFVGIRLLERRVWFCPALPDVWFEVTPEQSLAERAQQILTLHYRAEAREGDSESLSSIALRGKAYLTSLEVNVEVPDTYAKPKLDRFASLWGGHDGPVDGARALRQTGRLLNHLYPDDLARAIDRTTEVAELAALLAAPGRPPIILLGKPKVGKSTILHEVVWQMEATKQERGSSRKEVWLLSPQRLISGQSHVGEWENQAIAIFKHASELNRVLVFDDLLGLLTAGVSAGSDLNVAAVLRPFLERKELRLVAEITPSQWRALKERDRALTDLFHVIPVNEPTLETTRRMALSAVRQLEERYDCDFKLDAVPTCLELQARFVRDAAFPGKAVIFLQRLAMKYEHGVIDGDDVVCEFANRTGINLAFVDKNCLLDRARLIRQLGGTLIGQPLAVEAFVDVLVKLRTRLNDPRRPLGVFLLLGPTGTGKTQAAKSLATCVFGTEERLLRFDMNEYHDGGAAARLAGSAAQPDGLLSGAVRREPFSVILLDEIEKAAPEVFDLLLGVLDEGRLTDALGRTADFTQSIILLTSNLGARESRSVVGFGAQSAPQRDEVFVSAAEKFFRPEFYNRLDRVIPFRALEAEDLSHIASVLVTAVFARDGFRRRGILVETSPEAQAYLTERGYHPQLGARALKRTVERELTQPLAAQLSGMAPGRPLIIQILVKEGRLTTVTHELHAPSRLALTAQDIADQREPSDLLQCLEDAVGRLAEALEAGAPRGAISLGGELAPGHARYFHGRDQLRRIDTLLDQAWQALEPHARLQLDSARIATAKPSSLIIRQDGGHGNPGAVFDRQVAAESLEAEISGFLEEASESSGSLQSASALSELILEVAYLESMLSKPFDDQPVALLLKTAAFQEPRWLDQVPKALALLPGVTLERGSHSSEGSALYLMRGPNPLRLLASVNGLHLISHGQGFLAERVRVFAAATEAQALALAQSALEEPRCAIEPGPVLSESEGTHVAHAATGLVLSSGGRLSEVRTLLLTALPLPCEITAGLGL